MKPKRVPLCLAVFSFILSMVLWSPVAALAQETGEGLNSGNYNIQQSIEFGYRWTDFTGNQSVFDTFVNLHQGPRLLGQTLEMRSLNRSGSLFDNLYLTNFGYGGDPNNFSMLRVSKDKWYGFNATFRRDQNYWDYDLLANPLNPTASNPSVPILNSPHRMHLIRRMSDFNLLLLPQSRVRFRLGYSRNVSDGPSFSSIHEGTDALLFQDWKTTLNSYHLGVDFRLAPRTNISYDQFFQYFKGDTSYVDQNFMYQLADGTPVDLGLIFDTSNSSPCRTPIAGATTTPPTVNPSCNAYLAYTRSGPMRTKYPTEQVMLQSSSIKNLDIAARFVYNSSDTEAPIYNEFFDGLVTRTGERQDTVTGPASAKRVSVSTDFDATYTITPKFRIVDQFRFWHYRIPGQWVGSELALYASRLNLAPANPETTAEDFSMFLGQDTKLNTLQLEYDFNKHVGGRLGYRYRHRTITQRDFQEEEDTVINEHSLLMGLWLRPIEPVRVNYDMELMSADNAFTRISPRQLQRYKLRANYRPEHWVSFGGSLNINESRDNVVDINHKQHSRSYGFNANVAPGDRWSLDMGYDYNNVFSLTNICFAGSFLPPTGSVPCPILISGTAALAAISSYDVTSDFVHTDIMFRPVKQVTVNLGYSADTVFGQTLLLNPNATPGPLQHTFHRPYGSVAVDVVKGWTVKGAWGFYDYSEPLYFGDPTGSRSFRGNLFTLSLRYSL
jgi:hypothetical protein